MVTDKEHKKPNELVVSRIRRDLRDRLSHLSAKRGVTISSLINESVMRFLNAEEFSFDDLMEFIHKKSSLRIHETLIEKELKNCPGPLCKEILEILSKGEPFLLEAKLKDVPQKIKELNKNKIKGIFLHISKEKINVDELNNTTNAIDDFVKNKKIDFKAVARESENTDSTLIFIVYKEEGNGGE